jgi:ornithine cyclodeaminase/alanine dehydrogenase-like protein (mu-crystallin family)
VVEVLDAEETAARLSYMDLAESIRGMALKRTSGRVQAPARMSLPLPEGGVLLAMPAPDGDIAITQLVTVLPQNPGRDLSTIQGEVVVMEATTGRRPVILDGSVVTARRTAAHSLLAARELAPRPDGALSRILPTL